MPRKQLIAIKTMAFYLKTFPRAICRAALSFSQQRSSTTVNRVVCGLTASPPDPILEATANVELAKKTSNPVIGTVGLITTPEGKIHVPTSVRQAIQMVHDDESRTGYVAGYGPIAGDPTILNKVREHFLPEMGPMAGAFTLGGTGALMLAKQYLKRMDPYQRLIMPAITWTNHENIFRGITMKNLRGFEYDHRNPDLEILEKIFRQNRDVCSLLFHGQCHNPTGFDADISNDLIDLTNKYGVTFVCDLAYPGLNNGLCTDMQILTTKLKKMNNALIAISFSKVMGLYGDRAGAFFVHGAGKHQNLVQSNINSIIRSSYSNYPVFVPRVINKLFSNSELTKAFYGEVHSMATMMNSKRKLLKTSFEMHNVPFEVNETGGLFTCFDLTSEEITKLASKGVATVDFGKKGGARLNVCAVTPNNADHIASAISNVLVDRDDRIVVS